MNRKNNIRQLFSRRNLRKLFCCLLLATLALPAFTQELSLSLNYYNGSDLIDGTDAAFKKGRIKDLKKNLWTVDIDSTVVDSSVPRVDYRVRFKLVSIRANQVAAEVHFKFNNWSPDNFVFVPAIVYAGNKFEVKQMKYPPYWYDKKDWNVNMPTTTPLVPTLEKSKNSGKITLSSGNASTPLMAFYSPLGQNTWMLQTCQSNKYGNYSLTIEEYKKQKEATFSIGSPCMREKRAVIDGFMPSGDKAVNLKKGNVIEIRFSIYRSPASSVKDMYALFMKVRKILNPVSLDYGVMPYSEVWRLMDNLYQSDRWDESINMYTLTKPGSHTTWNHIWQLGWVGGAQVTLPMLTNGSEQEITRVNRNLNVIFSKTQASSGFFKAIGNGTQFAGFGFETPFKYNETFVRSQGDFLYMSQKHFEQLKRLKKEIPPTWLSGIRKQADAFVKLWRRYGQVGQFVDVENGDICIGGSTAGAIVPAGLALASQTFNEKSYLQVADSLAEKYYQDYVLKGYTTGGPGEILSSPDSESAFGLFESFMTLYEVTKNEKWLQEAKVLLPICASWVVSYDYDFPARSVLGKLKTHSCGAVWASIANKHAAPAICTWSGESLLKYFRATRDADALDLLRDIAHGLPQYISSTDRPIANLAPGEVCERVNLSDWEGKENIGGNIFGSCSWVETAAMLTVTQLPSIYIQKDASIVETFDNLNVKVLSNKDNRMTLQIENPTRYDAQVKIYLESSKEAKTELYSITNTSRIKKIVVKARESIKVTLM